jgi:hypothetical protein
VEASVYQGSVVDKQRGTDRDDTASIAKARTAFAMLRNICASKEMKTSTKMYASSTPMPNQFSCPARRLGERPKLPNIRRRHFL